MVYPLIILGGGLSGLAAGIRFARFGQKVLILEKHLIPGGLNSYYFRQGHLVETGLHAMTNYAPSTVKGAPLNRLFRQLKLKRKGFITLPQKGSEVLFPSHSLRFSNEFSLLQSEVAKAFPHEKKGFQALVREIRSYDAFAPSSWLSAKERISSFIGSTLLRDMLLCPLMIYGNSEEEDMDYAQFVIMFRSVFLEGFFRPKGSIKDFLTLLVDHFKALGGEIRYNAEVDAILSHGAKVAAVRLKNGEEIQADSVLSTVGAHETLRIRPDALSFNRKEVTGRMGFVETILLCDRRVPLKRKEQQTILFYNTAEAYHYRRPQEAIDLETGVICFPEHFEGASQEKHLQIRITHPANYDLWAAADNSGVQTKQRTPEYLQLKKIWQEKSIAAVSQIIGPLRESVLWSDFFTPLTVEKFTKKVQGAIYGSPVKVKDGKTLLENLFLAGTDQGFLGIVGAMLSGITIVNQRILLSDNR